MSIFEKYKTWVFDFDGVILDSNPVKTEAFKTAFSDYGPQAVQEIAAYHVAKGGVSRFAKVDYFFDTILKRESEDGEKDAILNRYASDVYKGLRHCAQTPNLDVLLLDKLSHLPKIVISGSHQEELRALVKDRNLSRHFDEIYGSPDSKDIIFAREIATKRIQFPAIFIGDSLYDYEMAEKFGLDFYFASDWTEVRNWQDFFQDKSVQIIDKLADLLD